MTQNRALHVSEAWRTDVAACKSRQPGKARHDLTNSRQRNYAYLAAAKSVAGRRGPNDTKAHKRPQPIAGAFFVPAISCYGGLCGDTFGCAGFLCARSANPVQPVTIPCVAASGDGSQNHKGTNTMTLLHALNPSVIRKATQQALADRAAAHRAMAIAALRSDSSLKHRLARYNHHMDIARALEAVEVAQ